MDIYIADYGWVTRFGMTFTENSQNFSLGSRTSWATESPHTSRAFPKKEQPRALQWRLTMLLVRGWALATGHCLRATSNPSAQGGLHCARK